jgi:hypothetical protein
MGIFVTEQYHLSAPHSMAVMTTEVGCQNFQVLVVPLEKRRADVVMPWCSLPISLAAPIVTRLDDENESGNPTAREFGSWAG